MGLISVMSGREYNLKTLINLFMYFPFIYLLHIFMHYTQIAYFYFHFLYWKLRSHTAQLK